MHLVGVRCVTLKRFHHLRFPVGKDQSHPYTQYQAYTSQGIQLLETVGTTLIGGLDRRTMLQRYHALAAIALPA